MQDGTPHAVEAWFGPAFGELAPMLRQLHRAGGTLAGEVRITFPGGVRGALGRRLARRLGLPCDSGAHRLRVDIHSHAGVLHWDRQFDDDTRFCSSFVPVGHYPDGYWMETAGPFTLQLGVAIVDGGWHWRHRATAWRGLRLPAWLGPHMHASKAARDGHYHFEVAMSLPLLGTVMAYGGDLLAMRAA